MQPAEVVGIDGTELNQHPVAVGNVKPGSH